MRNPRHPAKQAVRLSSGSTSHGSAALSPAEALRDARAALPGDALHQATGWAFTAFGAT